MKVLALPAVKENRTGGRGYKRNHKNLLLTSNPLITHTDALTRVSLKNIDAKQHSQIALLEHEAARREMAHELHDSVNPLLCVAKIYIEQLAPSNSVEAASKQQAIELISAAIERVKQVSYEYSGFDHMNQPLVSLIKELAGNICKLRLFKIDVQHTSHQLLEKLGSCQKLAIYRITQEQLNNIIKYSKAKQVFIRLTMTGRLFELDISDDGVGFDPRSIKTGVGFKSISKRIMQLGGEVEIFSREGKGCYLKASFNV